MKPLYNFIGTSFEDLKNGKIILIDKPLKWTSFQVVKHLKYQILNHFNERKIKIGHCGTLDPLSTGLLIVCIGKFTKKVATIQNQEKKYTSQLCFGATTPSYDLETAIDKTYNYKQITLDSLSETLKKFTGELEQYPPIFSAKKINGKRAYEFARKNKTVELSPSKVIVSKINIKTFNLPYVELEIECSKGTYIRALAHDIGKDLNSGAHLSELRRTKIGDYAVDNAIKIIKTEINATAKG